MSTLNSTVARVTQRIRERSRGARDDYLALMELSFPAATLPTASPPAMARTGTAFA